MIMRIEILIRYSLPISGCIHSFIQQCITLLRSQPLKPNHESSNLG